MAGDHESLHVVMFPWFAFGHISPFVQLSNKLSIHGVRVSFFSAPGNIERIKSTLHLTPKAQIIPLPIPSVDGLSPGLDSTSEMTPAMAELLKKASDLTQPQVKALLSQLKPHFVFFDFGLHWLPKLAADLSIKTLHFSVYSAISSSYLIVPARRPSEDMTLTNNDLMKPPKGFPSNSSVTSMKRFQAEDFMYLFTKFDSGPTVYQRARESYSNCTAVVMKTCKEMEGPYVDFLQAQFQKPVFLTGPLVPEPPSGVLEAKWASWLGQFPAKSVIFCSFGSETFLSRDQIEELALGLELTGLPFFLVLNFPSTLDGRTELNKVLPSGFLERVQDRGIVHAGWVQQQLILAHASVGCFVCHSGLSSLIEAWTNECQLALLPFKGDQFFNAKLLGGDMKAAAEINRRDEDGYFGRYDIYEAIKSVMMEFDKEPGKSIRASHKKWREFLLNEEVHRNCIAQLVEQLKIMS
uniref:Glycosyltransferase n=1 Tax=Rhizophora mucronata TaxID=61149 RepID=A0A2P2NG31_RHIMU